MHYLLHIDTAADTGTIALSCNGQLLHSRTSTDSRNYASVINILIDEVLAAEQIDARQLSAIVVCAGPGSYTGLRIGLATAKALCYVLDKPLLLDNKLTLLAFQEYFTRFPDFDTYVSILYAREQEYFIAAYDKSFNTIIAPKHIHAAEMEELIPTIKHNVLITGDIDDQITNLFKVDKTHYSVKNIINNELWAKYAYHAYKCNEFVNLSSAEPFYLKQAYTTKPASVKQ